MWHRHLGHADMKAVLQMVDKPLVEGLEITRRTYQGICKDCIFGKITRRPFNEQVTPETRPLERVSVDLWGRAQTRSCGGAWYMMLYADGGTSVKIPYFLKSKDEPTTLAMFQKFKAMAEKQTGHTLLCIRFDKGREFDNKLFIQLLETNGIWYEKIPKDSSVQNGVVE